MRAQKFFHRNSSFAHSLVESIFELWIKCFSFLWKMNFEIKCKKKSIFVLKLLIRSSLHFLYTTVLQLRCVLGDDWSFLFYISLVFLHVNFPMKQFFKGGSTSSFWSVSFPFAHLFTAGKLLLCLNTLCTYQTRSLTRYIKYHEICRLEFIRGR